MLLDWRPGPALTLTRARARRWLELASEETAHQAARRAPVRTGRLQRSIEATRPAGPAGRQRATVHARAPYALWVEAGTRRTRAQPYLRPALELVIGVSDGLVAAARAQITEREARP